MKKFITKLIIIFIIFFIIDKSAYYLLKISAGREYDQRFEMILSGQVNKDVIIIGSSRAAHDVLAGQIELDTNMSSFNLGYRSSGIHFHKFLLEHLFTNNKIPKKILYIVDNPDMLSNKEFLHFRFDVLRPSSYRNSINNVLVKEKINAYHSKWLLLSRMNKSQFSTGISNQPSYYYIDKYGSQVLTEQSNDFIKNKSKKFSEDNEFTVSKNKIKALHDFISICSKNKVELIFVFPPNFNSFNKEFYTFFVEKVVQNNEIITYDLDNDLYSEYKYFYDPSHLNKNGAKIFTSELSTYLNHLK